MSSIAASSSSSSSTSYHDTMHDIPENIMNLLNNEMKKISSSHNNDNILDFSNITPSGETLSDRNIANILIVFFTWTDDHSFVSYKCPVTKVKVTENGPIFDLPKLAYGSEFIVVDQYPQLEEHDVLTLGLLLSINLCRSNSTLKTVDLQGNSIEENVFLKYILSGISFDTENNYCGTFLLRHPDLKLNNKKIKVLLEGKYVIEEVDDTEGTDYINKRRREHNVIKREGDAIYSPIEAINLSGNKLAGFFGYFNHHPNLTTLNLAHTECCGKSSLYTIDEKGKVRPEIRKGSKFDVEDQFMIQPKYYIKTNTEKDRRRRLFTNCLKVGAAVLIRSSFHSWNQITSLNLSGCGLYGHPTTMIRKVLIDSTGYVCKIEHLDLSLNPMIPLEVTQIVESLQFNSNLKTLNLNSTCVFGEVWKKLSLNPDVIPGFEGGKRDGKSRGIDDGEGEFDELFSKMSFGLEHNATLELLDLGNTELLANHIDTLTNTLRQPDVPNNSHRNVVGGEHVSLLGKRKK